jgi:hypothetical protein
VRNRELRIGNDNLGFAERPQVSGGSVDPQIITTITNDDERTSHRTPPVAAQIGSQILMVVP